MNQNLKTAILEANERYGDIEIKCTGADSLPLDMILEFQGGLKKRTTANLIRLCKRIFAVGFVAPFFVWDNAGDYMCLDGHGRIEALCAIREAGVPIPGSFPVAYIQAEDEAHAREVLLSITSQYGEFDESELGEWLDGLDAEIAETLRLVDGEMSRDSGEIVFDEIDNAANEDKGELIVCPKCGFTWEK